ncbi:MAG TPA: hypothetical protein PLO51_01920 [Candidatus Micrarchaeota archaeon]|nr:hypothetical protein [Candidatus Micrarchaeota archaeon]
MRRNFTRAIPAIAMLFAMLFAYGCVLQNGNGNTPPPIVGNDSDAHGCKASAGYSWCGALQKCVRSWEENCTSAAMPQPCTTEAKICPDGSAVGRQGPNCEFALCPAANYTLYGSIKIGPLCPVEPCGKTFDYSGTRVNVYDAATKSRVAQADVDYSGHYGMRLAPGNYLVNVTDAEGNSFGYPGTDYTQSITIEKANNNRIELDFNIDTGIR